MQLMHGGPTRLRVDALRQQYTHGVWGAGARVATRDIWLQVLSEIPGIDFLDLDLLMEFSSL